MSLNQPLPPRPSTGAPARATGWKTTGLKGRFLKPFTFILCLVPIGALAWNAFTDNLSANPIDDVTDTTGTWTLRFVLITLAITPVRKIFGWNFLGRVRRMIGLFTFFYATLHFLTYLWLDQFFDVAAIVKDVYKRPFITAGF